MVRREPGGRRQVKWALLGVCLALITGGLVRQPGPHEPTLPLASAPAAGEFVRFDEAAQRALTQAISGLPLVFEPNRGQAAAGVSYLARGRGFTLELQPRGMTLDLPGEPASHLSLTFAGAQAARLVPERPQQSFSSYLLGDDPATWQRQIPHFGQVRYAGLYPGIEAVFHGQQGALKFDLVVAPGADPGQVRVAVDGASRLTLDGHGNLLAEVPAGRLLKPAPIIYQTIRGQRVPVEGGYVLEGNGFRFRLGAYDRRHELVIDPTLEYATFLGGSGAGNEYGNAIGVDNAGNVYVAGETASTSFPTAGTPLAAASGGGADAFVAKFDPTLSELLWSTYLGGDRDDQVLDLAVDPSGRVWLAGQSLSTNAPFVPDAEVTPGTGFVALLSADGSRLEFGTRYGGGAVGNTAIAVDALGRGYVAGAVATEAELLPSDNAPYPTFGGGTSDGFIARFADTGQHDFATFLGGAGADAITALGVTASGRVIVAGVTGSANFPTTPGALQAAPGGANDAFVTSIETNTGEVAFSTYLGGDGNDAAASLAVTPGGDVWVGGSTASATGFPLRSPYASAVGEGFFGRLNAGGGPVTVSYAAQAVHAVATDTYGNLYVAGPAGSFPNLDPIPAPAQPAISQLAKLETAGSAVVYSTGFSAQQVNGLAWSRGRLYVTGVADAQLTPTDAAFADTLAGATDAFAAVVSESYVQPDLAIRDQASADYLGNNLYNTDAAGQTATANTVTGTAAVFPFVIENDGNVADTITVTATAGNIGWAARYFDAEAGGTDITGSITSTGVAVRDLEAGASVTYRVELTPDTTVVEDDTFSVTLTAVSGANAARTDVARATATRIRGPRLEYAGTRGYLTDGVDPDSGGIATSFDFRTEYRNSTGTPATVVLLHLSRDGVPVTGSPFTLSVLSGTDPNTGIVYQAVVTGLTKGGRYTYRMSGSDGTFPCTGPLTAELDGPEVANTAPTVSNVAIDPDAPLTDQDLRVTYTFTDADGDADLSSVIDWTINGNPVVGLADPKILTADRTAMGDEIVVRVTPGDGEALGDPLASDTVTIQTRALTLVPVGYVGVQGRNVAVTAHLVDGAGEPAAGESVTFGVTGGSIAGGFAHVVTDANGEAVTQVTLGPGENRITASSGGAAAETRVNGRAPGSTTAALLTTQVTADQDDTTVEVQLTDRTSGQPVAGLGVVAVVDRGAVSPLRGQAVTDATGLARFTMRFSMGTARLTFTAGDATVSGDIQAVPGGVARATSTVTLAGESVPGDNTTTLGIVVTLKDAEGNPVAGVPGSSLQLTGDPDLGVVATFGPTDAQGVSQGSLTARRAGLTTLTVKVLDPSNNQLTTVTDALVLKVLGIFAMRLQPGLNLIGTPIALANPEPGAVFAGVSPLQMARYLPEAGTYLALGAGRPTEPFRLEAGRAFWIRSTGSEMIQLAGDPVAAGDWSTKLSGQTWTLASIPTTRALTWDPDRIRVSLNDIELGTLAASPEMAAPYAWIWNAGRQRHELIIAASLGIAGSSSTIPAGSGFWLRQGTRTDLTGQAGLIFNTQDLARARSASETPAGPGNWTVALTASAEGRSGSEVTIGVSNRLGRELAIDRPPLPAENTVQLDLIDPATSRSYGAWLDSSPVTSSRTWRLRVRGDVSGPVTIAWPSANRSLPAGYRLVLTDPTTGQRRSLSGSAAMQLELGATQVAELELTMTRQTGDRLAIGLQGHAGRSRAAALAVTLNQPADVTLRVVGLGGRVVRQWSAGHLEAGASPVTWDGLDANGRRVPAGTYRFEAWAQDDLGDAAIATTVVTVR